MFPLSTHPSSILQTHGKERIKRERFACIAHRGVVPLIESEIRPRDDDADRDEERTHTPHARTRTHDARGGEVEGDALDRWVLWRLAAFDRMKSVVVLSGV